MEDDDELGWLRREWASSYKSQTQEFAYTITEVDGLIPAELKGTYFRNGGGRFERGSDRYRHPFDGDGFVQQLAIQDGEAFVRAAYVKTPEFLAEEAAGRVLFRNVFGTQRAGGMHANALDYYTKNVANTHVVVWGGRCLALWEAGHPYRLDPVTLATIGPDTLDGLLRPGMPFASGLPMLDSLLANVKLGGEAFAAHPHVDPATDTLVTFKYTMAPALEGAAAGVPLYTAVTLLELNRSFEVVASRTIELNGYGFVHDFCVTQNYYVVFQNPVSLDLVPFVAGLKGPAECLLFERSTPLRIHIVPRRRAGPVRTVTLPPSFVFHHANAYEDETGRIVVDSVTLPDLSNVSYDGMDFLDGPIGDQRYTLQRTVVDGASVTRRELSPRVLEFPKVSPRCVGARHRYVYATGSRHPTRNQPLQSWIKIDTDTMTETNMDFGKAVYAGEAEFVARPGGSGEDDGWLVGFVYDSRRDLSAFAVVDAQSMSQVALLWLRHHLPQGLHGSFVGTYYGPPSRRQPPTTPAPAAAGAQ